MMKFTVAGACVECGTPYLLEEEFSPGNHDDMPIIPPNWASVRVSIDEPVISAEAEAISDMILRGASNSGIPVDAYIALLEKSSPKFSAAFQVCPDCREKGETKNLWSELNAEYVKAVQRQIQEIPPDVMGQVISFVQSKAGKLVEVEPTE